MIVVGLVELAYVGAGWWAHRRSAGAGGPVAA
jgi:hypothetical protein